MTRFDVNASILLTDLPLLQRPRAVRDAGFAGIEFWWPFETPVPGDRAVDEFVTAVQDAEVQLVSLNLFAGDMAAGERGLLSWPGRSSEFRDNLDATIGIGERLGCRIFNALYGNRLAGHSPEQQDELAAEQLAQAVRAAARIEATVVVEPLSALPNYPLRTAADVYAAIDRAGADNAANTINAALLADLYHLSVNGDDVDAVVADPTHIGHVQIADAPGRGRPGTGTLPIERYLATLDENGYDGWVGLEYAVPGASSSREWIWSA